MKVAVVTAYYREDLALLRRCHDSVLRQTHACTQIFVADGHPREEIASWDAQHMILPKAHGDYGNTPRALGSISALNQGFDAVAYLDADNWYAENHVESLAALCRARGCKVAFAGRQIVLSTGELYPFEERDEAERRHVDTNCFFITAGAAFLMPIWGMMDPKISAGGDRVMLSVVRRRNVPHAWTGQKTLFYESRWPVHFRAMGKEPPPDAHGIDWRKVRADFSRERNAARLGFDAFPGNGSNASKPEPPKRPALSVVIPTYRRKEPLLRCLDSLAGQLNASIDVTVIDNNSPERVDEFVTLPNVKVVRNEANIGAVGNILRAFDVARADWIWILGDDDRAHPDGIATCLRHIEDFPEAKHMFFSNYMGVIGQTASSRNVEEFIQLYDRGGFGGRLWLSGQLFNKLAAQKSIRYAYAYPSSSPQVPLVLLLAGTDQIVFSNEEIGFHTQPDRAELWDHNAIYDQMNQIFSLPIDNKLRSHLARCLSNWFSGYEKHFLEVINARFRSPRSFAEMRRVFFRRWETLFFYSNSYKHHQDLLKKMRVIDSLEDSQRTLDELPANRRRSLFTSDSAGDIR